jgi:hypothetical protein
MLRDTNTNTNKAICSKSPDGQFAIYRMLEGKMLAELYFGTAAALKAA